MLASLADGYPDSTASEVRCCGADDDLSFLQRPGIPMTAQEHYLNVCDGRLFQFIGR